MPLDHKTLLEYLDYDPVTGNFTWKISPRRRAKKGMRAGGISNNYWAVFIQKKLWYAHRLAWFYMTGTEPIGSIDHIDRNKLNNSFSNLRLATVSQNSGNSKKHTDNSVGYKGVRRQGKSFSARICVAGVHQSLGTFPTAVEAAMAYDIAAINQFGRFAQTNRSLGLIP